MATASLVHCVPQEPFWSSSCLFGSMRSQWLFPPQGTAMENAVNQKEAPINGIIFVILKCHTNRGTILAVG